MKKSLPLISIIIPALNEEENMVPCLESAGGDKNAECLVVDGGSRDRTVEMARQQGAGVHFSPPGRARQMNCGARAAKGEYLLFLHADTRLPAGFGDWVRRTLRDRRSAAGAFAFRLNLSSPGLKLIEHLTNFRSRYLRMPYGDQAIFVRSDLFREVGGFPEIPVMEDFEFIRRLRKKGRIQTVPSPAVTSARMWQNLGVCKATLLNQAIIIFYYLGMPLERIHRLSRRKR